MLNAGLCDGAIVKFHQVELDTVDVHLSVNISSVLKICSLET